jgi:hypothetical protein
MRPLLFAAALLIVSIAAADESVIRLSEPVTVTDEYEVFGSEMRAGGEALSLAAVMESPAGYAGKSILVETRVSKVCQKKGCFFIAQDGDALVRVSFKDYGFFVPTDIGGKRVTLSGVLVERNVSTEQAEHFNADLGDDAALGAGVTYEIVADSVRVPKAAS